MPTTFKFANFIETELEAGITAAATSMQIPTTMAAAMPVVVAASSTEIRLTLWDGVNDPEIVAVTENNQSGALVIVRAKESTTARAWPAGTQVLCTLTAEVINTALAAYFDINVVLAANFLPLTGGTLTGALTLSGAPTNGLHAATKTYADGIGAGKLATTGGTMSGSINMNNNRITTLPTPISTAEPSTKGYVDTLLAALELQLESMDGHLVTGGSSTVYTLTTGRALAALVDGLVVAARVHTTSGAAPTLTVDSTAATPIRHRNGTAVPEGALLVDMPYRFVYSSSAGAWLLDGAYTVLQLAKLTVDGETTLTGNATVAAILSLTSTSHFVMPSGTTAQRPASQVNGRLRFNSTIGALEYDNGGSWQQLSFAQPIAAGFKNLVIQNNSGTPNTQMDIDADAVTVETTTGTAFRLQNVNLTCNLGGTGANGLDTGAIAINSWYALLVIYNPTTGTTASLAVLEANFPSSITLPSGYTAWARVGWARTNASSQLHRILQKGRCVQYVVSASVTLNIPLLTSGVIGSVVTPTYVATSVAGIVPPTAARVHAVINGQFGGGTAAQVLCAPNGNYSTAGSGNPPPLHLAGTTINTLSAWLTLESTSLYFASNATGGAALIAGWEDNI